MGSDDLYKKRRQRMRERKEKSRNIKPDRILIVCEGVETEPNYLNGLKRKMCKEHQKRLDIEVEGTGRCTRSLVQFAEKRVRESSLDYNEIWCVFDKDSFNDFDEAIEYAEEKKYRCAWSNESFELWFLLHFRYIDAQLNRYDYNDKLCKIFKELAINNGKYEKNLKNIYEIITENGSESFAMKSAINLEKAHSETNLPSNKNPMTLMHLLVRKIKETYQETGE